MRLGVEFFIYGVMSSLKTFQLLEHCGSPIRDNQPVYSRNSILAEDEWIQNKEVYQNIIFGPGAVAQACNPSALEGRGGWITRSRDQDHPGQHGETPSLLKKKKISWARWRVTIIPATQEAEAGEMPEPRRLRLRWAEIAPLHSSLGNKSETPSPKKKKN